MFLNCFQQYDFFSEEGKIRAAAERAGRCIGWHYGARAIILKTDPILLLVKEGDTDGIIDYLECDLSVYMTEIPEHTYMDFMEGFYDGYDKGRKEEPDPIHNGPKNLISQVAHTCDCPEKFRTPVL